MADLTDDDIRLIVGVDPDEESVQKALKQINAEIEHTNVARVKLEAGMQPGVLQARIASERQLAAAQRAAEQAEHDERIKQAGGRLGYMWEQLKEGMGKKGGTGALLGGILGGQGGGMLGQMGGMTGQVLGGPGGAMAGEAIAEMIPKVIAAPARAVVGAMSEVAKGLQGLQGALGPVGVGLDLVSSAFDTVSGAVKSVPIVGEVLGPLLDVVGKIPGIFKSVLETATTLVGKVSPGVMKQFNIALEDAQATIGQAFLPVIQQMIPYVKELSVIIAQALPSDEEMRQMFGAVFNEIKSMVQELAPLIRPIINMLTTAVRVIAGVMKNLTAAFMDWAHSLGLVENGVAVDNSGRGAISAARPASLSGIEEYQRRLQLETFQGGRDAGGDPMKTLPTTVTNISSTVNTISNSIITVVGLVRTIANILGAPKEVVDSARTLISETERTVKTNRDIQKAKQEGRLQHVNPNPGWTFWDLWK